MLNIQDVICETSLQIISWFKPIKMIDMKKRTIIFLLLCTYLISCAQKEPKNKADNVVGNKKGTTVEIPVHLKLPDKGVKELNVSEFADTIFYVPLETNSKSLLSGIFRTQLIEDGILISSLGKLFLFAKNGKFIRQIGKQGKGPGEYQFVTDFVATDDTILYLQAASRH